jgi:hypothetical protein
MIKRIERITCIDHAQGKGRDAVFVIEHGRVIARHIEDIDEDDFGGMPYAG